MTGKKEKDLTGKEKALRAVVWLRTFRDHQHNMLAEIDNVRKKYEGNSCAIGVIDEVMRSVVGRMTSGNVDRVAIEAIKAIAPEIYDEHVPRGEIFKKMEDMFK